MLEGVDIYSCGLPEGENTILDMTTSQCTTDTYLTVGFLSTTVTLLVEHVMLAPRFESNLSQ